MSRRHAISSRTPEHRNPARAGAARLLPALLSAFAVVAALAAGPARGQATTPHLDAALLYGPEYPTQRWLPVRLGFSNPTDRPIAGSAVVPVPGVAEYRTPVLVPAHARLEVVTYVPLPAPPPREEGAPEAHVGDAITVVTWEGEDLSQIARTDLRGKALVTEDAAVTGVRPGGVLLATGASRQRVSHNLRPFLTVVQSSDEVPMVIASTAEGTLPADRAGYDAVRYVVWDMADASAVDHARQAALLDFVERGGVLIVASPAGDGGAGDPTDSFLGPHLPVRVIGRRQARHVDLAGAAGAAAAPIQMREPVELCEALADENPDGRSRVLLRDANYVHAAYRPLGLGRVVFTSFPVNGPADGDPRVAEMWRALLLADEPRGDWSPTAFDARKGELLQSMIGRSTVSFAAAAAVAAGFVALAVVAQLTLRGARRPGAFLATAAAAAALSVVLLALGAAQRSRQQLVGARLVVVDASPEGGGSQRELLAYLGREREDFALRATGPDVAIRPVVAKPSAPPRVVTAPPSVPAAGVHELTIERVWQAGDALPADRRAGATATFGPDGLRLGVDNHLGGAIERPLLLWGSRAVRLDDVPAAGGPHALTPRGLNPPGDFRNATVVSDVDRLRGGVLGALMTASHGTALVGRPGMTPQLAGWVDPATLPPLVTAAEPAAADDAAAEAGPLVTSQALVRLPVRVQPSAPGTVVRIDSEYMWMRPASFGTVPYNLARDEWTPTTNNALMLLTFEPPAEIGAVRPTRATVELDVSAPGHVVRIRRGQAPGGVLTHEPGGPLLAEWDKPLGRQVVEFDCGPADVDAEGRVWLLVAVTGLPRDASEGLPPSWKINSVRMSYVAEVTGPPRPPSLNRRPPTAAGEPASMMEMPTPGQGLPRGRTGGGGMPNWQDRQPPGNGGGDGNGDANGDGNADDGNGGGGPGNFRGGPPRGGPPDRSRWGPPRDNPGGRPQPPTGEAPAPEADAAPAPGPKPEGAQP